MVVVVKVVGEGGVLGIGNVFGDWIYGFDFVMEVWLCVSIE